MELRLRIFLTSALDRSEWMASGFAVLPSEKSHWTNYIIIIIIIIIIISL